MDPKLQNLSLTVAAVVGDDLECPLPDIKQGPSDHRGRDRIDFIDDILFQLVKIGGLGGVNLGLKISPQEKIARIQIGTARRPVPTSDGSP